MGPTGETRITLHRDANAFEIDGLQGQFRLVLLACDYDVRSWRIMAGDVRLGLLIDEGDEFLAIGPDGRRAIGQHVFLTAARFVAEILNG